MTQKLHLPREIRKGLGGQYRRRCIYTEHHESHAASAFFPSPFDEAAILTLDGVGEWATASLGHGRGNRITIFSELRFPHSLGLLYSAFTYFCGFRVNSGEYKLMGLAPYGEPVYADLIRQKLIDLKEDGSFRMDMSYFRYCQGLVMTSPKFARLFGGPPRRAEGPLTQREMDMAASIQQVTEEIMLRAARHLHARTGMKNLCLAGGVALNCVGNGRILREGPFERLWIQPAAGDAGGALGTALVHLAPTAGQPAHARPLRLATGLDAGAAIQRRRDSQSLDGLGAKYRRLRKRRGTVRPRGRSDRRAEGGRLGSRADGIRAAGAGRAKHPRRRPQCRDADADEREDQVPRVVSPVRPGRAPRAGERILRLAARPGEPLHAAGRAGGRSGSGMAVAGESLRGWRNSRRFAARFPAVTHVDYSARLQTVDPERHGRLYRLLGRSRRRPVVR